MRRASRARRRVSFNEPQEGVFDQENKQRGGFPRKTLSREFETKGDVGEKDEHARTEFQLKPDIQVHNNPPWWFFEACAVVEHGMSKDIRKLSKAIQRERTEYNFQAWVGDSQKRFPQFETTIGLLTSQLENFPTEVVKTVCEDTIAVLNNKECGVLKFLRATGATQAETDLLTSFSFQWKRELYREAVWEYLVSIGQEYRWRNLKLGVPEYLHWLEVNFSFLMENDVDENVASTIVELLFCNKNNSKPCSYSPRCPGAPHGTPASACADMDTDL